jgi:hypothetical protein
VAAIRFAWNANLETDLAGYRLYAGRAPAVYDAPGSPKGMGNVTQGTFDINEDGVWFFALKAHDTELLESVDFSAEITGRFLTPRTP